MSLSTELEVTLETICAGRPAVFGEAGLSWRDALPVVARFLTRPMKMERVEQVETLFKRYLQEAFTKRLSGSDARFIAEVSKNVGFVLKFKPYGVKCATALGYSVFFLRPGMGFSLQRHRTRKTELFHMLEILDRGLVYISTSQQWDEAYDKDAFNYWLDGVPDARYRAYSRRPDPGDVYLVTELDTVHSVLGCVLEEFATVSVDLVDRLHDQNTGRDESPFMERKTVMSWLSHLPRPLPHLCWESLTCAPAPLPAEKRNGVTRVILANTREFLAERLEIGKGATLRLAADNARARSLFCLGGTCEVTMRADGELGATAPIVLASGEVIIAAPGMEIVCVGGEKTSLSSHTIQPELALR